MIRERAFVCAAVVAILTTGASAQELSRYRVYALETRVADIVAASAARAEDVKTLHERPARVQELQWRAPFMPYSSELADPVREVSFRFLNDVLYRLVVTYERDRTLGLTDHDIIESLSVPYGVPVLAAGARTRLTVDIPEGIGLARWENESSSVTLVRNAYSPEYRLVLMSKALNTQANAAIRESVRLDALEAPQRERDRRRNALAAEDAARDNVRTINLRAFRP